jgi:hypothetical protein
MYDFTPIDERSVLFELLGYMALAVCSLSRSRLEVVVQ